MVNKIVLEEDIISSGVIWGPYTTVELQPSIIIIRGYLGHLNILPTLQCTVQKYRLQQCSGRADSGNGRVDGGCDVT